MNLFNFLSRGTAPIERAHIAKAANESREKWIHALQADEMRAWLDLGQAQEKTLTGLSVLLMAGLLYFLTPVLKEMYSSLGADPPWITNLVLGIGGWLQNWGLWLGLAVIVGTYLLKWLIPEATKARFWLGVPLLGPMLLCGLMERWSRTLGMLHHSGVPLVRAVIRQGRLLAERQALSTNAFGSDPEELR